MILTAIK